MLLISLILFVVGFFFPPSWLGLAGIGIYWYASRKSRRAEAVEERVRRMVLARQNHATFPDLYFEAARAYAIEKGGGTGGEQDSASVMMVIERTPYFVVFVRDLPDGGTMISVTSHDRIRDNVERFADGQTERSVENLEKELEWLPPELRNESNTSDEKTFLSQAEIQNLIHANRSKAAEVLGEKALDVAWRGCEDIGMVAMVVIGQAIEGDVSSLIHMIEHTRSCFQREDALMEMKVMALRNHAGFCHAAVHVGLNEYAFQAMLSYACLFEIYVTEKLKMSPHAQIACAKDAVNGLIEHANLVVEGGDPELANQAKMFLAKFGPHAENFNAI